LFNSSGAEFPMPAQWSKQTDTCDPENLETELMIDPSIRTAEISGFEERAKEVGKHRYIQRGSKKVQRQSIGWL
jgi:hypothetical protein